MMGWCRTGICNDIWLVNWHIFVLFDSYKKWAGRPRGQMDQYLWKYVMYCGFLGSGVHMSIPVLLRIQILSNTLASTSELPITILLGSHYLNVLLRPSAWKCCSHYAKPHASCSWPPKAPLSTLVIKILVNYLVPPRFRYVYRLNVVHHLCKNIL